MRTIPTLCFLLVALTCSSQVYDHELQNHKEKTREVFFSLISKIADNVSDSTLTVEQQYMLFDPIVDHANNERSAFMQIRNKYLRQVPPPPEMLTNISFDRIEDGDLIKMLEDPKFTTITLLQCYTPVEIGHLVLSLVQPHIYQLLGVGIREASISHTFGYQVFARDMQHDKWQIWFANRGYVLRFNLDLNNMVVSEPAYTVPNRPAYLQLQFPFIPYKQRFEINKLYQEMNELRWNTYSIDLLRESEAYAWQDTVNRRLRAFHGQNQLRFSKVQQKILGDLKKGTALDENWEELLDLSPEENKQLRQVLQPTIIQPDEAAYQLFSVTNSMPHFNQHIDEIGKNAMAGFRHHVLGSEKGGVWKMQSKGYSIAFEYDWNIKTGTFSTLKVFKRKGYM